MTKLKSIDEVMIEERIVAHEMCTKLGLPYDSTLKRINGDTQWDEERLIAVANYLKLDLSHCYEYVKGFYKKKKSVHKNTNNLKTIDWYLMRKEVSVLEVAKAVKVVPTTLRNYISGRNKWDDKVLIKVVKHLNKHKMGNDHLTKDNCVELAEMNSD